MTKTACTVEEVRARVGSDPKWAQRAVVAIYRHQTMDEQAAGLTAHDNGIGFNNADARILTDFAKQILGLPGSSGRPRLATPLTGRQLAVAYRLMPKYARQLHRIASAKESS